MNALRPARPPLDRLALVLAQGFGSGLAARAPGTFGSLVGLLWLALLLLPGHPAPFLAGLLASLPVAVWACGRAERLLGRHDPGSVVLDEIVAVPCCFLLPLFRPLPGPATTFPNLAEFLGRSPLWIVPVGFLAFRLFDVWKPWPVRQAQRFVGGWGILADDLLAAVWVNVLWIPFLV